MLDLVLPTIKKSGTQGNTASYEIGPIEAGYGMMLGIALRRVLLASLPGAAVTAFQIEGVLHEFQSISHVKEDVTDIVLNIKKLRLRSFSDHAVTLRLEVNGEREVTAADISAPGSVEIVNPELHIGTLDNENASLQMELVVETGRGYVEAHSKEHQPIGVIPVDAIFSPIEKVSYTVNAISVGQTMNVDLITLEITTDGAISPDEALRQSATLLLEQFRLFARYRPTEEKEKKKSTLSDTRIPQEICNLPLEDLGVSTRVYSSLRRAGITKVGQVLQMDAQELLALRNVGEKALQELADCFKSQKVFPQRSSADDERERIPDNAEGSITPP